MSSKLKAAWLCPCVGTGGADALQTGLIRYAQTVDFTGIGIMRTHSTVDEQVEWALKNGVTCPMHVWWDPHKSDHYVKAPARGLKAWPTALEVAKAATADADIAISWCCGGEHLDMRSIYPQLGVPVIELAQNEDKASGGLVKWNHIAAHYYAACSQSAARLFPEEKQKDVHVIYNGIDPIRCAPRQGREANRERLGYTADDRVILFLGRLVNEKNPEAIVQALTALPPHYKALFVGRGDIEPQLVAAAKRYAPERCQIVDFCIHPGDYYAAADCFCLPSDFEGDPLAVHEAQLAGLPCVVAEYSAVDELEQLFETKLYWRVPQRPTTEEIAAAIVSAVESPDERIAVAREATWRHFTLASIAYQWEELLHECVADWRQNRLRGKARRLMRPSPMTRP